MSAVGMLEREVWAPVSVPPGVQATVDTLAERALPEAMRAQPRVNSKPAQEPTLEDTPTTDTNGVNGRKASAAPVQRLCIGEESFSMVRGFGRGPSCPFGVSNVRLLFRLSWGHSVVMHLSEAFHSLIIHLCEAEGVPQLTGRSSCTFESLGSMIFASCICVSLRALLSSQFVPVFSICDYVPPCVSVLVCTSVRFGIEIASFGGRETR